VSIDAFSIGNKKYVYIYIKNISLQETNIAMANGPLEEVFPIEHGDFPLIC